MYYEVIPGREAGKVETSLTYRADSFLSIGTIVEVQVGKKRCAGVVVKKVAQPKFACKDVVRVLYSKPLPLHLAKAAEWMADYYQAPLSTTLGLMLPVGVLKQRRSRKTEQMFGDGDKVGLEADLPLNPQQKNALQGLQEAPGATKLLFGVTGSGKTNVYLKLALDALERNRSTVLLVPEIALTGQLVRVFQEFFGDKIVLIHSKQTEAARQKIFDTLMEKTEPRVVVGPRSALFAPLNNLGLIIVDEEHESSYYQENPPRYSAIRVASYMASVLKCSCILGSATPNITDYFLAQTKGSLVTMTKKAKQGAKKARIEVIDFKERSEFSRNRYFSNALLKSTANNLAEGRQTLIFHNRRGSSPLTICEGCGHEFNCPNCFLPLTLHADDYEMVCHTCGHKEKVPFACPECGSVGIIHKGFGTKLLETEIRRLFPKARVMRFDADTKKGEGLDTVFDAVKNGEVDILIGTQMLAKGLDLPKLATVGVVQADAGLALPDFAADERVFQLLTQVIGRVGRGHTDKAEVLIQTFQPQHPVLKYAIAEDFEGFSQYLLAERRRAGFPPYKYLMRLTVTMKTEATVLRKMRAAATLLGANAKLSVSPPMPAFHEHTANGYTWEMVARSGSRQALTEAARELDKSFKVILDPPSLL